MCAFSLQKKNYILLLGAHFNHLTSFVILIRLEEFHWVKSMLSMLIYWFYVLEV